MNGEILKVETAEELSGSRKEIERLTRDRNLKEVENRELIKKITKLDMENYYLKKREATLTALEKSLPQRIKNYEKKKAPKEVIKELEFLNNMLMMEKERILNKEVEEENETAEINKKRG